MVPIARTKGKALRLSPNDPSIAVVVKKLNERKIFYFTKITFDSNRESHAYIAKRFNHRFSVLP